MPMLPLQCLKGARVADDAVDSQQLLSLLRLVAGPGPQAAAAAPADGVRLVWSG